MSLVFSEFYNKAPVPDLDSLDDLPLPPLTWLDRPLCSVCKEPNLSLRDERCISCRVGLRLIGG